jgi:crossover junction endodeoxyribonuclease RuvC
MIIIAIDPGLSGGIAWRNGTATAAAKMPPTEPDIAEVILGATRGSYGEHDVVAYIENVPIGMPGKGAAMAKLNANAGFIRGLLCGVGIRTILVRPVKWQKHYELGTRSGCDSDSQWKNKLKAEAQRRFPHLKVTLDTADSLLILDYAIATGTDTGA